MKERKTNYYVGWLIGTTQEVHSTEVMYKGQVVCTEAKTKEGAVENLENFLNAHKGTEAYKNKQGVFTLGAEKVSAKEINSEKYAIVLC